MHRKKISVQVAIVGGPPRDEFFAALQLRHLGNAVKFQWRSEAGQEPSMTRAELEAETTYVPVFTDEVIIDEIAVEDGSGNNWLFKGRFSDGNQRIGGYYNTGRRTGWIANRDQ